MAEQQLHQIHIKKVLGPMNAGTAVLLGNDEKTFVMFIGTYEGAALLRELNGESPPRPMTHDLLCNVLTGFELKVTRIVISDIVDNTFCATLTIEQACASTDGEWNGRRNLVQIDARPSDCLVLALKEQVEIFATQKVLDRVQDVSEGAQLGGSPSDKPSPFGLKELDLTGFKDKLENFELESFEPDDPDKDED